MCVCVRVSGVCVCVHVHVRVCAQARARACGRVGVLECDVDFVWGGAWLIGEGETRGCTLYFVICSHIVFAIVLLMFIF